MLMHFIIAFGIIVLGAIQMYCLGRDYDNLSIGSTFIGTLSGFFILTVGALFL